MPALGVDPFAVIGISISQSGELLSGNDTLVQDGSDQRSRYACGFEIEEFGYIPNAPADKQG